MGEGLLGRVVDPLGRPLDANGPVATGDRLPIERPAAAIMDRAPVTVPLQTGLKVIDALIPIGHGQRELILGDRRTGKTAIALPIIETEAQNISAYIPTNLISITDGQIYLSPSLFEMGVLPAVDVAKSVSRVGGKAQQAAYRAVAGDLKLAYAQFEELETFARFGARLDEDTRKIIEHGRRIRACLKQPEFSPVSVHAQIAVLLALTAELFDPVPLDRMTDAEHAVHEVATKIPAEVCARFETAKKLSDDDRKRIIELARQVLAPFLPKPEGKANS